ncbi:conserved hypothetical protein [Candidatus Roizmanbacteria bacterium]|nr:conserved hypothetical protein [Candidatus Roizmanbacteria bacterium]
MKKIKAILCDFDGTLVDENGQYLPKVKILIKKILNKNVRFSLATGRAYYSVTKRIEKELGMKGIHILHGGAMIFDSIANKVLFLQAISNDSTVKIIKYLSSQRLTFALEAKNCAYMSRIVKENNFYPESPSKTISELNKKEQILKILVFARVNRLSESEMINHIKNLQKSCSDISVHRFEFFNFFGADITSERATKHTAVLEYLKILDLAPDEVVAIGDGPNDYPLFTACGFGIAMVKAPKELKEIADLVVNNIVEALEYIYNNLI